MVSSTKGVWFALPYPAGDNAIAGCAGGGACCRKHRGRIMTKLTNTQLKILSQAAQRENGAAFVPAKTGTVATRKLSESLVERKLMRAVLTMPGSLPLSCLTCLAARS